MAYRYDRRTAAGPIPLDKGDIKELADRILKKLPLYLKFRDDYMDTPMQRARGYNPNRWQYEVEEGFSTTNVRNHPIQVEVHVGFKKPEVAWGGRDYVTGGAVSSRWYGADRRGRGRGFGLHTKLTVNSTQFVEQALKASATWKRIQGALNPHNERKIREAVSRALVREWPRLQELYPQDPDDEWDETLNLP